MAQKMNGHGSLTGNLLKTVLSYQGDPPLSTLNGPLVAPILAVAQVYTHAGAT